MQSCRSNRISDYTTTLAAWYLHLDSELVFVGDAATTEPSGASQRYGIEWTNLYRPFNCYDPVKHGHARSAGEWPYSSFERCVQKGWYPADWGTAKPQSIKGIEYE